ncbi:GH25 family lysozyme [Actinocatenispora rupis]|uniref:Glycosyl hydrolases family 25 n=1 Tax=Actinocatenispora rupis TaxID=519421 RepID=A0A8J3J5P6_9ACTN|nr:GH25 family lysozyme [Actinocatenispora rupis]GID14618.1 hypothetical protein Aru02nite_55070 [Actinocatenispora rupis]
MTLYGLDCSNHQGNMSSLGGVAASFFVHKLTEGTTYVDPNAAHNLSFARSRRIPVLGGYHFIRAGNGAGQADQFAARARQLFGHDLHGHLWQLDCESDATWADVRAFKQRWDAGTDHAPILFYTGDWWLQPRGWNVASLGFAGLWAAPNRGYVGAAQNVRASDWVAGYGGFSRITVLQYDARPSVGDTNQYQGGLAQLKALVAGRKDPEVYYTSVGRGSLSLKAGQTTSVHFTSAAANTGNFWGGGGYSVGAGSRLFMGDVTVTFNAALPGGIEVATRFAETDPDKDYAVAKAHPWAVLAPAAGIHEAHASTVSWVDRGHHLWVQLRASADLTVAGVWAKVGLLNG